MPFDKNKKFHFNTQQAMGADKSPPRPARPSKPPMMEKPSAGGSGVGDAAPDADMGDSTRTMITHNDDGSHMVQHADGEETGPHDSIEEALQAVQEKHGGAMPPHGMQHEGAAPRHGMPMHEGHAMMGGM